MTTAEVHEALKDARALMAEHGLAKWQLEGPDGSLCIRGALNRAVTGQAVWPDSVPTLVAVWPLEEYAFLVDCERAMGFDGSFDAPAWNNEDARTLDDVLARFDAAIAATAPELVAA